MKNRFLLQTAVAALSLSVMAAAADAGCVKPEPLRFREDGTFRIMQINDTQDDQFVDFRTPELMRKAIAEEKPDLIVCAGDCITGGQIASDDDVRTAIDAVFQVIEDAGVPFIIAFGNHDEDAHVRGDAPNMGEVGQLAYYRNNFSCNINKKDNPKITGDGDMVTLVYSSPKSNGPKWKRHGHYSHDKMKPKLAVWALDSGRYAPDPIAGQSIDYNDNGWDWIRQDQVAWYRETSMHFEKKFGHKIPGIMFFHIPLFEWETMWTIDKGMFASGDVPNTQPAVDEGRYSVEEERNECICTGPFNSGLYTAAQERGDVMGMFVGHDHINNYVGNFHGILLGYGASSGFGPYGFSGNERNRLRGVRIHDFVEDDVESYVPNMATHFKRAGDDYGMCLAPNEADCNGDPYYPWTPASAATVSTLSTLSVQASTLSATTSASNPEVKSVEGEKTEVGEKVIADQ